MMEKETLRDMHEKVDMWLSELAGDKVVPKYTQTEEVIIELYDKMERNREMDRLAKLRIEDLNGKCEEYKMETVRMTDTLEAVGLPLHALSNAGKMNLNMLSQLAHVLNIKDVKTSSYIFAMNDLKYQLSAISREISKCQSETDTLISEAELVLKGLEEMKRRYKKLEQNASVNMPAMEARKKDTMKLQEKVQGYKRQIDKDDKLMKEIKLDAHLHHASLVQLAEERVSLDEEQKTLKSKLQNYSSLPPDVQLAKVKLEELKRYINQLEKELDEDIEFAVL